MADSTMIRMSTMGILRLTDGGAVTLNVPYDVGDLKCTGVTKYLNEVVDAEARGGYISSWYGKRTYPELSFSALCARMSSASVGVLRDFLNGQNAYSANVSTLGAGRLHTVKAELLVEGSDFLDADEVLTFEHFFPGTQDFDASEIHTWAFGGKVYGRVLKDGVVLAQPIKANA